MRIAEPSNGSVGTFESSTVTREKWTMPEPKRGTRPTWSVKMKLWCFENTIIKTFFPFLNPNIPEILSNLIAYYSGKIITRNLIPPELASHHDVYLLSLNWSSFLFKVDLFRSNPTKSGSAPVIHFRPIPRLLPMKKFSKTQVLRKRILGRIGCNKYTVGWTIILIMWHHT